MRTKENTLVSVVLPTFNRGHIIELSIRSVLAQTYNNLEVIVIDDASTDDTEKKIEELNDSRIKYLKLKENVGASAARNKGISLARGIFVAFQDSDDIWFPKKIERQIDSYNDMYNRYKTVAGCFCRYIKISGNNGTNVVPLSSDLLANDGNYHEKLLNRNLIGTPTLLAKKEALDKVGGFDSSLSTDEDWDLALKLTKLYRFALTDEILVCSLTSSDGVNTKPRSESILKIIQNNIDSFDKNKKCYSLQIRTAAIDCLMRNNISEAIKLAKRGGFKFEVQHRCLTA
ncbi:glycosyltransferase family 2 protein [Acidithiobacillus albertensis]|uniref:glycosyltransferase family 2 protein n=1 Tax=Acidithiobacillus albertensis TaxID=119978 RepID=UPI001C074883|nr:glycosyltransferase family 2 protein [Acidithiobacillus albertensis]MBU2742896.1 glycosyltransferase [Acidithiobacillus albertensis]